MRFADIKRNDCANGEGICVSLWMQGCPHRCKNCFNQCTWDFDGGTKASTWEIGKKICNELIPADGIIRNFSVLGGEPLYEDNIWDVNLIISMVREKYPNIKIFLWTGYTIEELIEILKYKYYQGKELKNILNNINYLIEGRFIEEQKDLTLKWRGSRNQRILTKEELQKRMMNNE